MGIKKAVIPAAGWGTRFLPITKAIPKEMLPLLNKPIIQYCIEEATACGVEQVVIITASGKNSIEDYFDSDFELESMLEQKGETRLLEKVRYVSNLADIGYIRQRVQLGLGHAVLTVKNMIGNEPFFLMLPDDIFENKEFVLKEMIRIHESYQCSVVAVKRIAREEINRYGIVACKKVAERVYKVSDLIEKPEADEAPSDFAIMGRYLLAPEIFECINKTKPGRNGEIQLTDALKRLIRHYPLYAYEFEGERWDAGTPAGWLETTITLALKEPSTGPRLRNYLNKQLKK
ncbi:MAG: UTP--glucose-1-phosphate uridylyltransferase GalU [Dehalococcoidales bacterium]|nr:UTP--glucose-1-phosphate uridylyltransferase GalU [Dehalococcoidales bacterium]